MVEKPLEKAEDIVWLRNCADNPEKRADIVPCMCSHRVSTVEEERLHAVDAKFEEYLVAFAEAELKLRASFSLPSREDVKMASSSAMETLVEICKGCTFLSKKMK